MKTLKYGIKHIEGGDRAKDLPTAMAQSAQSIVNALDSFNYNGKDPNLVLARVAAIEAQLSGSGPNSLIRQSGQTAPIGTMIASGGTFTAEVTFPKPFASRPMMGAPLLRDTTLFSFSMWIAGVTPEGFTIRLRNLEPKQLTIDVPLLWDAYGQLA